MESQIGKTVLGGKFSFNTETTVICMYCKGEFKYHRSNSSLSYHLRTRHAFTATLSATLAYIIQILFFIKYVMLILTAVFLKNSIMSRRASRSYRPPPPPKFLRRAQSSS